MVILRNLNKINKIKLQISNKSIDEYDFEFEEMELLLRHAMNLSFVQLVNRDPEKIKAIHWLVEYKDNKKEMLKFKSIKHNQFILNKQENESWQKVKNDFSSRDEKLNILKSFEFIKNTKKQFKTGSKNLIYYTVYFDTGYVQLLHKSIEGLVLPIIILLDAFGAMAII